MTDSQKRGRMFLIGALCIIATFIIQGFLRGLSTGESSLPGGLVGNGILLLILILAFRGGQVSLKLAKGCALLFAVLTIILLLVVVGSIFRGVALPETPTVGNTIPFILTVVGIIFSTWALFVSGDVKAFIHFQRELSHERQLAKIKKK